MSEVNWSNIWRDSVSVISQINARPTTSYAQPTNCKNCGAALPREWAACSYCGTTNPAIEPQRRGGAEQYKQQICTQARYTAFSQLAAFSDHAPPKEAARHRALYEIFGWPETEARIFLSFLDWCRAHPILGVPLLPVWVFGFIFVLFACFVGK